MLSSSTHKCEKKKIPGKARAIGVFFALEMLGWPRQLSSQRNIVLWKHKVCFLGYERKYRRGKKHIGNEHYCGQYINWNCIQGLIYICHLALIQLLLRKLLHKYLQLIGSPLKNNNLLMKCINIFLSLLLKKNCWAVTNCKEVQLIKFNFAPRKFLRIIRILSKQLIAHS